MMRRFLLLVAVSFLVSGCNDYIEKEREIGYKGKARVNPFLAFEQFVTKYSGKEILVSKNFGELGDEDSIIVLSADLLTSESFIRKIDSWISQGGHAIFLIDHAEMRGNEWATFRADGEVSEALQKWLTTLNIEVVEKDSDQEFQKVKIDSDRFNVKLNSSHALRLNGKKEQAIVSIEHGDGALTIINDASLLRNRTIEEAEHIEIIAMLLDWSREGRLVFLRGVGISFIGMLWEKGWMIVVSLSALLIVWLMRNMPRFGPIESEGKETQLRAYDHHLEMIGEFHWRLDRGLALLEPLRRELQDLCHQWQQKTGKMDEGLFEVLSSCSGIPIDRVQRAMTEHRPADTIVFSRAVADLQQMRKAFL
jgi:hypothetical protein